MSAGTKAGVAASLAQSKEELGAMARVVDGEIGSVASAFEGLAGHTDTLLTLASALIGCVEGEAISSVLPKVQTLGVAAKRFIEERLQATTGILETVTAEANLLQQLSLVTSGQAAIASKINALSYLTNIEVARLGDVGAGFHYLAHELSDFSRSVIKDTRELSRQTARRRRAIEDTKGVLSAELPRQREALASIEADLGDAVAAVERSLNGLARTPVQFKLSLEDIARQVAGVVAAIQAHDITRQQIEHVQEAFALITSIMPEPPGDGATSELVRVSSGLTIQAYQLRTIRETVANWAAQIKTCMNGIMQVSPPRSSASDRWFSSRSVTFPPSLPKSNGSNLRRRLTAAEFRATSEGFKM